MLTLKSPGSSPNTEQGKPLPTFQQKSLLVQKGQEVTPDFWIIPMTLAKSFPLWTRWTRFIRWALFSMAGLWRTSASQSWSAHLPRAWNGGGWDSISIPLLGRHREHSAPCPVFADQAVIPHFLQVEVSPGLHLAYQLQLDYLLVCII